MSSRSKSASNLNSVAEAVQAAACAARTHMALAHARRAHALNRFADLIDAHTPEILKANSRDLKEAEAAALAGPLLGRLALDVPKIQTLLTGIREIAQMDDPVGHVLARTLLDDGLTLEKRTVPIGVIAVVFESRPDVIPQILALILKSGNVALLKGGSEARHSNHAVMSVVHKLSAEISELDPGWAQYFDTREAFHALLKYDQHIHLVIPRGSNALVQSITRATQIPVLGHADGVCHIYVHASAVMDEALTIIRDAKIQSPTACNAVETVLVDSVIAIDFLKQLGSPARTEQIALRGGPQEAQILPEIQILHDPEAWHTEYSDRILAVKIVDSIHEAIAHINTHGSHHTDAILARDQEMIDVFLAGVDSACLMVNASTRFADGFRFGMGAEVGISTSKLHARGPVGLEGLVSTQFRLYGQGQIVAPYTGPQPKPFRHEKL